MDRKLEKILTKSTFYPERSQKLYDGELIELPERYEKVTSPFYLNFNSKICILCTTFAIKICQVSNGSYTSVFCVKEKGESKTLYAAKYMKDKTEYGNDEVEILKKLQNCDKIIHLVEDFHENYQTILITEYLTGKMDNLSITSKPFT